ncbi:unnamed protein product [Malus baccata var. baccata]
MEGTMDGVLFLLGKQKQGMTMLGLVGNRKSLLKFSTKCPWGQKNPPKTETQPASLPGWIHLVEMVILVKDITNGDRTRKVWKNKNRPAKPPGVANNNFSVVGIYTATRQRLDKFTREEHDVHSNIEAVLSEE